MGQAASTTAQHSDARRLSRRAQEEQELPETPRPRTRTSSLRNSLRGLVSPKRRHSVAGSPDTGSGSNSRRASRRWSRALSFRPPSPAPPPPEHDADDDVLSPGSLDTDLVAEDPDAEDDELSAFDAGEPDPPRERPPTPMPHRTPTPPPPALPTLALPLPPPAPAPPPPQRTGTFPPPGTLVVVQGVVHTTDVPPQPAPDSNNTSGTAAASTPAISSSSIDVLGTLLTVAAQATAASLLTGSSDALLGRHPAPSSSPFTRSPSPPRRTWGALRDRLAAYPPPASPSAAYRPTALPPPPTPNPLYVPGAAAPALHPAPSPLYAQGAGGAGGSSASGSGGEFGAVGDRERYAYPAGSPADERTAMLAEMARAFNLGLGLGAPRRRGAEPGRLASAGTGAGASGSGAEGGAQQQQQQDGDGQEGEEEGEGTFERFLVDLQADLRVALGPEAEAVAGPVGTGDPAVPGQEEEERVPDVEAGELMTESAAEAEARERGDVEGEGSASASASEKSKEGETEKDGEVELDEKDEEEEEEEDESEGGSEYEDAPSTSATTPAAEEEGVDDPLSDSAPPTTPTTPTIPPGAVNWWRLYRFPPIVSPPRTPAATSEPATSPLERPTTSEGATLSSPPTALPPLSSSLPTATPAASSSSPLPSPPLSAPATPQPQQPQTVVPVIVVGLQSVALGAAMGLFGAGMGMGMGMGMGAAGLGAPPPSGADAAGMGMGMPVPMAHEVGTQVEADPFARAVDEARQEEGEAQAQAQVGGHEEADERRTRRRSWWRPSLSRRRGAGGGGASTEGSGSASVSEGERVEDAYGAGAVEETHAEEDGASLEPTVERTEAEATPVPTEVPGVGMGGIDASRTFLIYVIGGYYPPEHGILNGAGGAESLEALFRELPELLGYARPPTASKADIARAGLTVLRPAELPEAEKAGRVVSNCVERCLICLDDYDPADEIRVLSCRHAFHLTCVDRWLETGRNNCPACRTKGVPTDPMAQAAAAHA